MLKESRSTDAMSLKLLPEVNLQLDVALKKDLLRNEKLASTVDYGSFLPHGKT